MQEIHRAAQGEDSVQSSYSESSGSAVDPSAKPAMKASDQTTPSRSSSELETSSDVGNTARRDTPSSQTSVSRRSRSNSGGISNYSKYSTGNAGPLPREVLHLTFTYLFEEDRSCLYPAMDVCQTWRAIIASGDYWSHLTLSLDNLSVVKIAGRFARHIQRCKAFAAANCQTAMPILRTLKLQYLDEQPVMQAGQDALFSDCAEVVRELEPCCAQLSTLSIHLLGATPSHLGMLPYFLGPLLSSRPPDPLTFRNVLHLHIDLPHIRGFPLSNATLAWFSRLRTLSIVCGEPFIYRKPQQPIKPPYTQIMRDLLSNHKAAQRKYHPRDIHLATQDYIHADTSYRREQSEYAIQREQQRLNPIWQFFATRSNQLAFEAVFSQLKSIHLEGCFLLPDLHMPEKGFPGLTSLHITRCKWGRGLWHFLSKSSALESLVIDRMMRDEEEVDDYELDEALQASHAQAAGEQSVSLQDENTPIRVRNDASTDSKLKQDEPKSGSNSETATRTSTTSARRSLFHLPQSRPLPQTQLHSHLPLSPTPRPPSTTHSVKFVPMSVREPASVSQSDDLVQDLGLGYDDEDGMLSDLTDGELFEEDWEDDFEDEEDFDEQVVEPVTIPPTILLPRLTRLEITEAGSPVIWTNVDDSEDRSDPRNTAKQRPTPLVHMPNIQHLSLSGSLSLGCRSIGGQPDYVGSVLPGLYTKTVQTCPKMSKWEFEEIVETFERGREAVPGEPSNEELYDFMSDEDSQYYTERPDKLNRYRLEWRKEYGLWKDMFEVDRKKLWAMVHGLTNFRPLPFALSTLFCCTTKITNLDLSHSNVSGEAFTAAIKHLPNLISLNVSGTSDLVNFDLSVLPDSCPRLSFIDARGPSRLTACGLAPLIHKIRDGSGWNVRLRVKVDDPSLSVWPENYAAAYRTALRAYTYLEFHDSVVDEELDQWKVAQAKGLFFSKRTMKRKMELQTW